MASPFSCNCFYFTNKCSSDQIIHLSYHLCCLVSDKPNNLDVRLGRPIYLKAIKCFYRGCKRPEVVEGPPVATRRPKDAKMWSDPAMWENGLPGNDTDVTIKGRKSFYIGRILLLRSQEEFPNNPDFDACLYTPNPLKCHALIHNQNVIRKL